MACKSDSAVAFNEPNGHSDKGRLQDLAALLNDEKYHSRLVHLIPKLQSVELAHILNLTLKQLHADPVIGNCAPMMYAALHPESEQAKLLDCCNLLIELATNATPVPNSESYKELGRVAAANGAKYADLEAILSADTSRMLHALIPFSATSVAEIAAWAIDFVEWTEP